MDVIGDIRIAPRGEAAGPAPLSLLQEQLWLVDQLDADQAAAYNVSAALRLPGPLAAPALRHAARDALARPAGQTPRTLRRVDSRRT